MRFVVTIRKPGKMPGWVGIKQNVGEISGVKILKIFDFRLGTCNSCALFTAFILFNHNAALPKYLYLLLAFFRL